MSVQQVGPAESPATPPRPAEVPLDAVWRPGNAEWELGPLDADGRRAGLVRTWRVDGTLAAEQTFVAGERDGAYRRFHEDGSVAREGVVHEGRPQGLMRAYGTEAPTTEPMQPCCVPQNAWRLEHDYNDGHLAEIRWYDRAGIHILPSGAPHPIRPASVPRNARYEEGRDQWVVSQYADDAQADGVWLRWARDGVLRERDEYRRGKAHGLWQRFDVRGGVLEASDWCEGGRGGAYRHVFEVPGAYVDARVCEERGHFDRDQAVGAWSLHDEGGAVHATYALGAALEDEALLASPAFATAAPDATAATWEATADALAAQERPVEALLATARAAAAARDAAPLRARLEQLALRRGPDNAVALATELVTSAGERLALVANGLVAGADAANLLRTLAALLTGRDRVALDLVDAALLIEPDRLACHVTRALIHVHLGRPDDARADAAALPEDLVEQREFIEQYTRVLFTEFPFLPARTEISTHLSDVPEAPEQPLENVVAHVQKYATRLGLLRAAIAARAPAGVAPPWLPPDLSALLPLGDVPLETWEFEEIIQDEADEGDAPPDPAGAVTTPVAPPEPMRVTVDERMELPATTSLPSLLRLARREWAGLCWLCWSAGLDRVALPTELRPPATFGAAAGMSIERLWRCRDKLITGGLRALTQGVPGFVWEGLEIDLVPAVLAEIAADEHVEMRAVFYWLCDAGVQSPWQDNLRAPD